MVGTHHREVLRILVENALLWWMTMIRMCKINGFSRLFCASEKRGGIPPLRKCENAYETALGYGF
jgi:hypothetical protein